MRATRWFALVLAVTACRRDPAPSGSETSAASASAAASTSTPSAATSPAPAGASAEAPSDDWLPSEACRSGGVKATHARKAPLTEPPTAVERAQLPLPAELLRHALVLPSCDGVHVVEHREEPGAKSTDLPAGAARLLDQTCCSVVQSYVKFARAHGAAAPDVPQIDVGVSFIPDDSEPRSMNDVAGRFKSRAGLGLDLLDGWYSRPIAQAFVPSGLMRPSGRPRLRQFALFAHELFHALSHQNGWYTAHPEPRERTEEALAREFVRVVGLPAPPTGDAPL